MTKQIDITPAWTPLIDPLIDLLRAPQSLESRDAATAELRRLLAAAGTSERESERILVALTNHPDDRSMRERLYTAAQAVDALVAERSA